MNRAAPHRGMKAAGILVLLNGFYIRGGLYAGGRDAWLSALAAAALLCPVALWLGWLARRGRSFFAALEEALPPFAAGAVTALTLPAALAAAVLTVRSFTVFVQSNILAATPQSWIAAFLLAAALMQVKAGRRVFGDWCFIVLWLTAGLIAVLIAFSVSRFDWSNLRPVLAAPASFGACTLRIFTGWLGTLLLLFPLFSGSEEGSPFLPCILTAGLVTAAVFAANTLILSAAVTGTVRYITYYAASVIGIGDFFQHVEILSAFVFQMTSTAALTAELLFICQGLVSLFRLPDERVTAVPAALLIYALHACLRYSGAEALAGAGPARTVLPLILFLLLPAAASLPGRRIGHRRPKNRL